MAAKLLALIILMISLSSYVTSATTSELEINTNDGWIRGTIMKSNNSRDIRGFLGIPYAHPPIGNFRFKPPQDVTPWSKRNTIYDATKDAPMCTQVDILSGQEKATGQEDCLYLNVFTPSLTDKKLKLPVMVYFHGGGFVTGSSNSFFYGPKYFLDHDVVLVTANYRDLSSPGNMGLKDQNKVLKWISNNIHKFNGNENSVTIFGQSAGGASVNYHMISPLSQGLFHRAISQSGTAFAPWAFMKTKHAVKNYQTLASHFNCTSINTIDTVNCLKTKKATEIIEADKIYRIWDFDPPVPFRPVIEQNHEGAFITDEPRNLNSSRVRWLIGTLFGRSDSRYKELNTKWNDIAQHTLFYDDLFNEKSRVNVTSRIRKFYFDNKPIDSTTLLNVTNLYSDVWFNNGNRQAIRDLLRKNIIFQYRFAYKGSSSLSSIFAVGDQTDYGICHCDDLLYLFPIRDIGYFKKSSLDNEMVNVMTKFWVNFATYGNPTPNLTQEIPVEWQPVSTDALEYFLIEGPRNFSMSKNLDYERSKFWQTILKN
ncbi:hypothetical protein HCN44_002311 [Aphidius gifuensis]|uniref:Carboxylesterase type B domain-containing protein n=1 Tax=Aphidius gifuensis TaxID=684658 RepID=A0A835CXJ7_APHGI|nr:hypothetical protein HCN44_002311 [Aphidius gifuensis]